jgi:hypothetical protein
MNQGIGLADLAQKLKHNQTKAKDLVLPMTALSMSYKGQLRLGMPHDVGEFFNLNDWSSSQLANSLSIPAEYFGMLLKNNSDLAAANANYGFLRNHEIKQSRLVRTVDGTVRAFLSNKYKIIDSGRVLETIYPILEQAGFEVVSCDITDRKFYLKVLSQKLVTEIKKGDSVAFGFVISNSDVGAGAFAIEGFVMRLVCTNGLIADRMISKRHLGARLDDTFDLLSMDTINADNDVYFRKLYDITNETVKMSKFDSLINSMRDASERKLNNFDLEQVVDVTMRTVRVSGTENKKSILDNLASGAHGAGLTQWGLVNAFTYSANRSGLGYEESTNLEKAGGDILNLTANQWRKIAEREQ